MSLASDWMRARGWKPFPFQKEVWQAVTAGESGLLHATTGSGKTVSLYTALNILNDETRNISTVEDPVEYRMAGVNQVQAHPGIGLDFAAALRSILRQDPDVVMVGEIRDQETADMAVQASLTGHLVLSTLHTNSAIGAVTRLVDMGVEPFLISSSLLGVLAQRLVRAVFVEVASEGVEAGLLLGRGCGRRPGGRRRAVPTSRRTSARRRRWRRW